MKNNKLAKPHTLPIANIIDEAKDIKIFEFAYALNAAPGQFIMLWIPGVDEIPLGVAYQDGQKLGILVCRVGEATSALFKMKKGDMVGIRGPAGTAFRLNGARRVVMVAGGYGVSPLYYLAHNIFSQVVSIDFIYGANCKEVMALRSRLEAIDNLTMHYATNDGSCGYQGYSTDLLEKLLAEEKYDLCYTVGPELMMVKVLQLADRYNLPVQLSIARRIKCAFGICGQCAVDDSGVRLCVNGPVVSGEFAKQIKDFGKYYRDASGKKINF